MESITTIIANIATSLGVLSFIGFIFYYRFNQKQFQYTVMISCIDRFQKLLPELHQKENNSVIRQYVDLTNEEFFYFQYGYIPKHVIVEWMDGIIDCIPIYKVNESEPLNKSPKLFNDIHEKNILDEYNRLKIAFTIKGDYDFNSIVNPKSDSYRSSRVDLIKEILHNIRVKVKDNDFKKALIK